MALLVTSCAPAVNAVPGECTRTAHTKIYSNAFLSQETGDVLGFELAIERLKNSSIDALLYVYEGVPNTDGIRISGRLSGKTLVLQGVWVEHLIEYPSKKETVDQHRVRIEGTINPSTFRGSLTIQSFGPAIKVRLARVRHLWLCKPEK
ncbi:MAG TPA: hypothetical protein VFP59_18090 [Candidatus Angelobacter sp.]|nr:hypothetical protein [Candidatus Angelobacter sp.]